MPGSRKWKPAARHPVFGPVAQGLERPPDKREVSGSIPLRPTSMAGRRSELPNGRTCDTPR